MVLRWWGAVCIIREYVPAWSCFASAKDLVGLNISLLIEKPGWEEDGDAPFEMDHDACGQPF
jgi:hypothetical protein